MRKKKSKLGQRMIISKSLEQHLEEFSDYDCRENPVYHNKKEQLDAVEDEVASVVFNDTDNSKNASEDDVNRVVVRLLIGTLVIIAIIVGIYLFLQGGKTL